jgi:hypothetical protein
MSLLTYENARPWAKAIKTAVVNKQMPPWFADTSVGEFRNAPKLTAENIKTLVAWAETGSREGDAKDKLRTTRQWKDGWRIQPDVIVSMAQAQLVAENGPGEVKEYLIANPFKEDTWVTSIEIRPSNPSVVHHAIVQVPEATQAQFRTVRAAAGPQEPAAVNVVAALGDTLRTQLLGPGSGSGSYSDIIVRNQERQTGQGAFMTMEAVYAPGSQPLDFRYTDSAKLVPGGRPMRLEVHYQPNGQLTTDQTMVGFTLAKAPASRRFVMMAPEHLVDIRKPIPAGVANYETAGELTFKQDVDLAWFMPHMHLRGKDMTYRLIYPDGSEQTALRADFSFHWQLGYELEKAHPCPEGNELVVTAHHDNSLNNAYNPAPGQAVSWGDLTAQEMMLPWFGVIVDRDAQPSAIASYKPGDLDGPFPMPGAPGAPGVRNVAIPVPQLAPPVVR